MNYDFYTVDVFTENAFGGNQLAVLPDATGLNDEQMQRVAREFNLSETTFVFPPESPGATKRLRIFTPNQELPFAGHPTVGSAFVLAAAGKIPLTGDSTKIVFEEGVGNVPVEIRCENGKPCFSQLTTAKLPELGPPPPPSEHIAAMLSLDPRDVLDDATDEPRAISCGVPFLYVPLRSIAAVRKARLNWEWWNQALGSYWARLVYLFSFETEREDADVHARMFAIGAGYNEDPATGAAASALAGYLAPRSDVKDGTLSWTVEQGFEMGRPSIIRVETDMKGGNIAAVRVGGHTVMVSHGSIEID